ncbi:MAG TPA: hypothetical protein VGC13_08700 [Longimicrobium sp.]|uniref:hypothetical protein n=1 Tax=Longimicrobium sp. TaxID=2029185 RepID=UPI002ED9B82A
MKDREQKARALSYAVSKRWFPQLELDVSTHITIQPKPISITDIDVFASIPGDLGSYQHILIDCKTGKNESPIGRALWLRGLMERMHADRGMCILRTKNIATDHRYSAAQLGVTLIAEDEFSTFGRATSFAFEKPVGAIGDISIWDRFFSIGDRYKAIAPAVSFSRSIFWMSESDVEACTRTLYLTRRLSAELDPAKDEHMAVVGDLAALFLHALARIVNTIFAGYLQPENRGQLSSALLLLLYGGRSSYMVRNRLKKMVRVTSDEPSDLSLPEWNRFVQLVRQALDAPYELLRSPLIVREAAWSILDHNDSPKFLRTLAAESPQGVRLAVLGIDYLCRASKLPPEFMSRLANLLMEAQTPAENNGSGSSLGIDQSADASLEDTEVDRSDASHPQKSRGSNTLEHQRRTIEAKASVEQIHAASINSTASTPEVGPNDAPSERVIDEIPEWALGNPSALED